MPVRDVLIVGAGPSGLATAIAAKQRGLDYLLVEKGVLVNSIFNFPTHMVFFTTPELLEIGGLPLVTPYDKPMRLESLRYYRRVVDTYELQITDAGVTHGMGRFSGSETDLANLALRVAISEHVRFQAGGAVGLLVLDEVFGPLDEDRKERMLLALERLKGRFRQVLVVTHDSAIKEQLPNAIQVEKLPGRRARATVLSGA